MFLFPFCSLKQKIALYDAQQKDNNKVHILAKMKYKDNEVWLLCESHLKNEEEKKACNIIVHDPSFKHILLENVKHNMLSKLVDKFDKYLIKFFSYLHDNKNNFETSLCDACDKSKDDKCDVYDMEYGDKGHF